MGGFTSSAFVWICVVTVAAVAVTVYDVLSFSASSAEVVALILLALCAAITHLFPIRSERDGASLRLTPVFAIAGAAILPTGLLTPFAALSVAPDLWVRRHRPRGRLLIGFLFNVAQTTLAAHVASVWMEWASSYNIGGLSEFADVRDSAALLITAIVFTVVQELLVAVGVSLDARVPLFSVSTFTVPALRSNALIAVLGVAVAGIWLAKPFLLVLVPPMLYLAHRMTRTAHLAHLAEVDSKTGLHNSRYFEQALEEEFAHSQRLNRPLSLLFVDLDHFKRVNDQYGHAAGDTVLRDLSTLLSSLVRKDDIVARFGGEEFVILLPGTEDDQASYLAERVRAAVEGHAFVLNNGVNIHCTVSVGVAAYPEHAKTLTKLLEEADGAMYRAKRTRNAVARAETLPAVPRLISTQTNEAPAAGSAPPPDISRSAPPPPSPFAPLLLWATVSGGVAAISWSVFELWRGSDWLTLLPFVGFGIVAEFLKLQVYEADRRQRITFSFASTATLAAVGAHPTYAPIVALTSALFFILAGRRQRQLEKVLFNLANPVLAAAVASGVYLFIANEGGNYNAWYLFGALCASAAYYVSNFGIVSLMIGLHTHRPLSSVVKDAAWYGPIEVFLGLTGAFVGGAHQQLGVIGSVMFVVPLLIMRFTLSFYAQRSQRTIETLEAAKTEVESAHTEKEEMLRKLIETVALIIDARDNSVSGHSRRVAKFAVAIGKEIGLNASELAVVHTAGLFHDLGKVGIPESILHKPAKLTDEEYIVIKEHAGLGHRILSEVPQLADIAKMVGEHHERFDGTGYPTGLKALDISLGGRILVVADSLETMLADRPYAKGRPLSLALAELDRCAGTHFDPHIVEAVHRALANLGEDFFTSTPSQTAERNWGAADQILAQVFT